MSADERLDAELVLWRRRLRQFIDAYQRVDQANSCIVATRLLLASIAECTPGVRAYPLSVNAIVVNAAYDQFAAEIDPERRLRPTAATERAWLHRRAKSLWIGWPDTPHDPRTTWPGHLVVIAEPAWLLDPSIGQAERVESGIVFERSGVVLPIHALGSSEAEGFLHGRREIDARLETGIRVLYTARPRDASFRQTPGWARPFDRDDDLVVHATAARWRRADL